MGARRVLVCAPRMPEFDREGGSRRIFHFIDFLQAAGWDVTYLARDATDSQLYARILRQRGVPAYAGADSKWVGDEYLADITALLGAVPFDLVIFAFWYIAEQYMPRVREVSPRTRVVVDSIDLHFLRGARTILGRRGIKGPPGQLGPAYAAEAMRELNTYAAADAVLTVSEKEARLVNDFTNDPSLAFTVPLMEDLPPSPIPYDRRRGILFIGNVRHPPNVEAIDYLCKDVLPRLNARLLDQHPVYIVGNGLDATISAYVRGPAYLRLVGWVPSVLPYLHSAIISVVPLLSGAGTKTKLIQTLTVGTPAVSTTVGIEGLNLQHERDVLVADDPGAFAGGIARLIEERGLWLRLAANGRDAITSVHGREAVRSSLAKAIDATLAKEPKERVA